MPTLWNGSAKDSAWAVGCGSLSCTSDSLTLCLWSASCHLLQKSPETLWKELQTHVQGRSMCSIYHAVSFVLLFCFAAAMHCCLGHKLQSISWSLNLNTETLPEMWIYWKRRRMLSFLAKQIGLQGNFSQYRWREPWPAGSWGWWFQSHWRSKRQYGGTNPHMAVSSSQHKDLSALDSLSVPAQVCTETVLERCVYPINAQLTETLLWIFFWCKFGHINLYRLWLNTARSPFYSR